MQILNETALKVKIVKVGLLSRLLILASIILLYFKGGFLPSKFEELMFIICPVSCMYITFFIRYIKKNAYRYHIDVEKDKFQYIGIGYVLLLLLNLTEFFVILFKALNIAPAMLSISYDDLFIYVFSIESMFGILAGIYISDLFKEN